jgi:hypothetical protein
MEHQSASSTPDLSSEAQAFFDAYDPHVTGWCNRHLAPLLAVLHSEQREAKVTAGALEIGVYHGKFFLLLNFFCNLDEQSYAVDLFSKQALNIDQSGIGCSLELFQRHLTAFDIHKGANVTVLEADSTQPCFSRSIAHNFRLISIDGGHTAQHTVADLMLAQELMAPEAVVMVDDILNPHWLGVIEGVASFLAASPWLIPFAVAHNKMFFAHMNYAPRYYQALCRSGLISKPAVPFFGHTLAAH